MCDVTDDKKREVYDNLNSLSQNDFLDELEKYGVIPYLTTYDGDSCCDSCEHMDNEDLPDILYEIKKRIKHFYDYR